MGLPPLVNPDDAKTRLGHYDRGVKESLDALERAGAIRVLRCYPSANWMVNHNINYPQWRNFASDETKRLFNEELDRLNP